MAILRERSNAPLHFPQGVHVSQRNTPALFGAQLIDAVPDRVVIANERSQQLVDELDELPSAPLRSRDPRFVERWLPALIAREADPRGRLLLRVTARAHAAIGQLELAVVAAGDRPSAALEAPEPDEEDGQYHQGGDRGADEPGTMGHGRRGLTSRRAAGWGT